MLDQGTSGRRSECEREIVDERDSTGLAARAQANRDRARDLRARLASLAAQIADTEDVIATTFERRRG
jgi:hypothetical protein